MNRPADKICSELKIIDVMQFYGVQFNNRGFANCPFHNEKTPSLKTYDNHYKCFGCKASGGIIDFVMNYENLTFQEAILRLDNDFNLGIFRQNTDRSAKLRATENRRTEDANQRWQEELHQNYLILCTVHSILYGRLLNGEAWLGKYQERLETLLDTFSFEEVRNWQAIWK